MPSPTMLSSQPKLSEVAKHLVVPEGIETTGWPAVRDKLSAMDVTFDRWQEGLAIVTLGKRSDGLYAASIGGVTWSIPRQVGKTFTVGHIIFALCILNPGMTVLWTAHRSRTSDETFDDMKAMSKRKKIAPYMDEPTSGAGQQSIRFKNGSRVMFGAREQGFGRGFTKVTIAVFDEAQILSDRAIDDMVPATNAVENALVIKIGTPPKPVDPSEIFTEARRSALAGKSKDALYVELGADDDASPDNWTQLAKANPSYPHRTSKTAVLRMKSNMTDESYRREGMGVWDEEQADTKALNFKRWQVLRISPDTAPTEGRVVYGVKFSVDGSEVALSAARKPAGSKVIHVEGIKRAPMSDGTGWLVKWLAERADSAAQIVVDGQSGSGALATDLREAGVRGTKVLIIPTLDQIVTAHAMLYQATIDGSLSHVGQEQLDTQVQHATRRQIGQTGKFGWKAPKDGSVCMLDSVTLAHWGAATTRRNPGGQKSTRATGRTVRGRAPVGRGGR